MIVYICKSIFIYIIFVYNLFLPKNTFINHFTIISIDKSFKYCFYSEIVAGINGPIKFEILI